jgi:hypothetical protein
MRGHALDWRGEDLAAGERGFGIDIRRAGGSHMGPSCIFKVRKGGSVPAHRSTRSGGHLIELPDCMSDGPCPGIDGAIRNDLNALRR